MKKQGMHNLNGNVRKNGTKGGPDYLRGMQRKKQQWDKRMG